MPVSMILAAALAPAPAAIPHERAAFDPVSEPRIVAERVATAEPIQQKTAARLLSDDELTVQRGGQTIVVNNQTLVGVVSGNTLGDYTSGAVNILDNALSNMNGLANVVVNTGALSNLQAAMSVTVNLAQ